MTYSLIEKGHVKVNRVDPPQSVGQRSTTLELLQIQEVVTCPHSIMQFSQRILPGYISCCILEAIEARDSKQRFPVG